MIALRQRLQESCHQVEGATFDLDYDTQAVKSIGAVAEFAQVQEALCRAIELKARLDGRLREKARTPGPAALGSHREAKQLPEARPAAGSHVTISDEAEDITPRTFN